VTGGPTTRRVSSGAVWEPIVSYSRVVAAGDFIFVSGCTSIAGSKLDRPTRCLLRTMSGDMCGRIESADLATYLRPIESAYPRQEQPVVTGAVGEGYVQRRILGLRIAE
jgi:hypothetical protein